jgi:hypothetical protein
MTDVEPLIVSELERMLPLPTGRRADWSDVLSRSALSGRGERWRWRPVLVAVVAFAALVGAGVAIAAGFGAFNGISALQHPQTPADRIDPGLLAEINAANSVRGAGDQLLADSARLAKRVSDGTRIYAVATQDGQLCALATGLAGSNTESGGASAMGCGSPLTQSLPTTAASFRANEATPTISWGIATDRVTAVSFMASGQEVTVPVKNNVWAYEGDSSIINSLTVHFNDGSTETIK